MKQLFIFILLIPFYSCTSDSISDLSDETSIAVSTYNNNVKVIIANSCLNCHGATPSNGAPNSLTTYENMKDAVLNRGLLDRISRAEGTPGAMPLGGPRLPQNQINIIEQWNTDGLLE
jgi:mono/diheme cytochrome c family protein